MAQELRSSFEGHRAARSAEKVARERFYNAVVKAHEAGWSYRKIAASVDVTFEWIGQVVRDAH